MTDKPKLLRHLRTFASITLLVACIGLLQYHSIHFWMDVVDPITGWAWSILLEGVALWLWSSRNLGNRLLGLVASVLVLLGPTYEVTKPLINEWRAETYSVSSTSAQEKLLKENIASLEASLATFLANSETRSGWLQTIQNTQAELADKRATLEAILLKQMEPPSERMSWQRQAIIVMQALALLLFQIVNVLAIRDISQQVILHRQLEKAEAEEKARLAAEELERQEKARLAALEAEQAAKAAAEEAERQKQLEIEQAERVQQLALEQAAQEKAAEEAKKARSSTKKKAATRKKRPTVKKKRATRKLATKPDNSAPSTTTQAELMGPPKPPVIAEAANDALDASVADSVNLAAAEQRSANVAPAMKKKTRRKVKMPDVSSFVSEPAAKQAENADNDAPGNLADIVARLKKKQA